MAFEKYVGWYGFGTRRHRYDLDEMVIAEFNHAHPGLEESPNILIADVAIALETIFRENPKYQFPEIIVFAEFLGVN